MVDEYYATLFNKVINISRLIYFHNKLKNIVLRQNLARIKSRVTVIEKTKNNGIYQGGENMSFFNNRPL